MKDNKNILYLSVLVLLNLFFKGFKYGTNPNSLSLNEIRILQLFDFATPINNYMFRAIPLILSTFLIIIVFLSIHKATKKSLLAFFCSLSYVFSPWLLVISRYLNTDIIFLLAIFILILLVSNGLLRLILSIVLAFAYKFIFLNTRLFPNIDELGEISANVLKLLDLRLLFFGGDPVSLMLKIPLTGFFMYIDILALTVGFYYIFLSKNNQKLLSIIFYLLSFGIIYFVILPNNLLFALKGIFIFSAVCILIGAGYYQLFNIFKKLPIIRILMIFALIVNIYLYSELFFSHFDLNNSFEWGYAETKLAEYILRNNLNNKINFSIEASQKITPYLDYFASKDFKYGKMYLDKIKDTCLIKKTGYCVVKEHELKSFDLEKDQVKTVFANYDGLPVYFVLPNRRKIKVR